MFSSKCLSILAECNDYKKPREDAIKHHIKDRLDESLINYNKDLNNLSIFISKFDTLRVLKTISRER